MKPAPERLVADNYPHQVKVRARFSDLDPLGHLNNVAIGRFYEEARVMFNMSAAGSLRGGQVRLLVAEVAIKYLHEGYYPDELLVTTGIQKIGRSSFVYGQALFQKGRCIGTADTVQVFTNDAGSAPIPDEFRAMLEQNPIRGLAAA